MKKKNLNADFELENDARVAASFDHMLKNKVLFPERDFAQRLSMTVEELNKRHQAGEVYKWEIDPQRFSSERLRKLSSLFPSVAGNIDEIQHLAEQNNYVTYPSWQIFVPEDPNQASLFSETIRPEVVMARKAYEDFSKEANADGFEYPPSVDDRKLFFFFNSSAGLSEASVADYIVKKKQMVTPEVLKQGWWYHENPSGGYS